MLRDVITDLPQIRLGFSRKADFHRPSPAAWFSTPQFAENISTAWVRPASASAGAHCTSQQVELRCIHGEGVLPFELRHLCYLLGMAEHGSFRKAGIARTVWNDWMTDGRLTDADY